MKSEIFQINIVKVSLKKIYTFGCVENGKSWTTQLMFDEVLSGYQSGQMVER
jgi:hypothetical protein